ncbi:hypothetical protein [Mycobacterium montefiorense]|uniref:hypothetical protein n=1 Tax=Mycobacterium montefiorense TaxID=154654 RepID=UPI0021C32061|nr:hypothetical protein [Mycobacterium montefiorense]
MKLLEPIDVDIGVINPHTLDNEIAADGAMQCEKAVVAECERMILLRIDVGCAAFKDGS